MLIGFIFLILLIVFPEQAMEGAMEGLRLCGTRVIPSLFPFFVASRLIASNMPRISWKGLNRLFGVSGNVLPALVLGFLGGYPVGVSTLTSLYRQSRISRQDAERAMSFCNNTGPGLFIGLIGGSIFGSTAASLALYFIHVISALTCGFFLSGDGRNQVRQQSIPEKLSVAKALSEAVAGAAQAMLQVCSFILLFSALSGILCSFRYISRLPGTIKAVFMGTLEITKGLSMLDASKAGFVAAAALMGWGGLCVHMQAMTLWQEAGLQPKGYFRGKFLHALLSAAFAALLCGEFYFSAGAAALFLALVFLSRRIQKKQVENRKRLVYNEIAR